ncbi:hypothetical protein [Parvibaculum sp.]|uniref:hypothetical protein n=1 Tax=Parvibaculum sp. TaxID=2024848 RepID=UPI0027302B54|nr:hypothetical protein [Parvibaculum sp.]MDP1628870.1 hypothetical protein [Parvibaculum sp.]MDP2148265.1 hypothetical protein [Parvibaculum sp.]MDP3327738.1 hypothetical protein [Parvibaculum sp.]
MKRQIERVKAVRPEDGLKAVDPAGWRAPPRRRDWIEYAVIAGMMVAAAYLFG